MGQVHLEQVVGRSGLCAGSVLQREGHEVSSLKRQKGLTPPSGATPPRQNQGTAKAERLWGSLGGAQHKLPPQGGVGTELSGSVPEAWESVHLSIQWHVS